MLVHVGFAMNRINEQEAAETLALLQEIANSYGDTKDLQRSDL